MSINTIIRITPDGLNGLEQCSVVPPEAIIDGEANEKGAFIHNSSDQKFNVGIWECTPYAESFGDEGYPCDEFCTVISGSLSLTDEDGNEEKFTAGESYFVPKGFKGTFRVIETMRKYYVLYEG